MSKLHKKIILHYFQLFVQIALRFFYDLYKAKRKKEIIPILFVCLLYYTASLLTKKTNQYVTTYKLKTIYFLICYKNLYEFICNKRYWFRSLLTDHVQPGLFYKGGVKKHDFYPHFVDRGGGGTMGHLIALPYPKTKIDLLTGKPMLNISFLLIKISYFTYFSLSSWYSNINRSCKAIKVHQNLTCIGFKPQWGQMHMLITF